MNQREVLDFLGRNQPLPPDSEIDQETIDAFDESRRFLMANPVPEGLWLLLGAFGDGDGFGVYPGVVDAVRSYPRDDVVAALDARLASGHIGVRRWCLQIAMEYPDPKLKRHFLRSLESPDLDERTWAASNLELNYQAEDEAAIRAALDSEPDSEIREILKGMIS